MPSRQTFVTGAAICAAGLLAYAVYFDYKRRNDLEFRKRLRKEQKKVTSKKTRDKLADPVNAALANVDLKAALAQIRSEPLPATPEGRETYLMDNLGNGERLAAQGSGYRLEAALCFYRALRVAPGAASVNFFQIIETTQPPEVFKLLMELVTLDVKARIEGYFDYFPPAEMSAKTTTKEILGNDGKKVLRRVLIAGKSHKAGETIYKESPVLAALDPDLASAGSHCACCLRAILPGMSLKPEGDPLSSTFCSRDCQTQARNTYGKLLFTLEPPVAEVAPEITPEMTNERKKAQEHFVEFMNKQALKFQSYTFLTAQFIAIYLLNELAQLTAGGSGNLLSASGLQDYTLNDHFERLRYVEMKDIEEHYQAVVGLFENAMPGLDQFLPPQRFATLMGKVAYNAFGVCFSGGRDDKPISSLRTEDQERTRTPYGTQRQIGSGVYLTSSYLTHSCQPNARISFPEGTSKMSLIATRDIAQGEELTIAFVDISQHDGESVVDARRRRRIEIARGWRMACPCPRCAEEAPIEERTNGHASFQDDSKAEEVVERFEETLAGNGDAAILE